MLAAIIRRFCYYRNNSYHRNSVDTLNQSFILHWGEMGGRWGINRATAQVHALLLLAPEPLHAQIICEELQLARSNVSVSLRDLQAWGLIKLVHNVGDRREYFEAEKDAWTVLGKIADKRLEREILPTLQFLNELKNTKGASKHAVGVISDFATTITTGERFYQKIRSLPRSIAQSFLAAERALNKLGKKGLAGKK